MNSRSTKQTIRIVGMFASVMGLSSLAFAHPPENIPPFTEAILDRLDEIETKIDNLETKVDSQSTDLRGVTQNWDKKLDATNGDPNGCNSDRFTCIFGDTAVRDNETGLVWDRIPDNGDRIWTDAIDHCGTRKVGGRKGWQLPLGAQLASLVDTTSDLCADQGPCLPDGHPFTVEVENYWSSTTSVNFSVDAWAVGFSNGSISTLLNKPSSIRAWCVRGGQSYDGQDVSKSVHPN